MSVNGTNISMTNTATELTCQQQQVEFGSPLPIPLDNIANVLRYMQITYYIICFPFGFFLNLLIVMLILRYKRLQNVTFILAFQVSASDLLNAVIVFPTSAANAIADRYVFTGLCPVIGFVLFYLRIARIYLMAVLAIDRCCTVFLPFWYHRKRHRVKVITSLSLLAWILAAIVALIPVQGLLDCYSFQRNTWACVPTNGCIHQQECSLYNSISVALSNTCNVVSLLLYFSLFCKARSVRRKIVKQQQTNSNCEGEQGSALHKQRRERRANITFFLLFLALAGVSFLPFVFFVVGRPIITSLNIIPHPAYTITGVFGRALYPLLTIIDPIVIMRNVDFREVTRNLCRKIKPHIGGQSSQSASSAVVQTSDT